MNQRDARRALDELSRSPAAAWIGNRVIDGGARLLQKCTRCGGTQTLTLPPGAISPGSVPRDFDEELFAWKRAFQKAHENCAKEEAVS